MTVSLPICNVRERPLTGANASSPCRIAVSFTPAARAQAAFEGRTRITPRDIALAAELALPHRVKAGPFRKSSVGLQALESKLADLKMQTTIVGGEEEEKPDTAEESKKKVTDHPNPTL